MEESIAFWRKQKGLTQKALGLAIARQLGHKIGANYAQRKIARFESGVSAPTTEELHAMADELGVEAEALAAVIAARASNEGPSRIEELGVQDDRGWSLMAVCVNGRPRPQINDDSFKAVQETFRKGHLSMAIFLPYPSAVNLPAASDHINDLVGYWARVRKSLLEANMVFLDLLGPELAKSVALYEPRPEVATSVLFPPTFRQFSLTIRRTEPDGLITKSLDAWTTGLDRDRSRPLRATGTCSLQEQVQVWESFFGEIIPHWIAKREFLDAEAYWRRIR
jgi:transcriptional regulator with XRE-family HTH domain